MKRIVTAMIALALLAAMLTGCGRTYDEYPNYELQLTGMHEYELNMNGDRYVTVEDTKWFPDEYYDDSILGVCDYNGTTVVYQTSSPICVFVRNDDRLGSLAPVAYLYKNEKANDVRQLTGENISKVVFSGYDDTKADNVIDDRDAINMIFKLIDDSENYVKIPMDKVKDINGNETGGYIYGYLTDGDRCEANRAGAMVCYSEEMDGLFSSVTILEYKSEFYYVISDDPGTYICARDNGYIGKSITDQLQ